MRAHPVAQGAMNVEISNGRLALELLVSPEEVFVANTFGQSPATSTEAAYREHAGYLLKHLRVNVNGQPVEGREVGFIPPQTGAGSDRAQYRFEFPLSAPVNSLRIEQDVLNELASGPGARWEATYVTTVREQGVALLDGALLTSTQPVQISSGARPSVWRMVGDYVRHGITHILTGYDHLLFIGALALAVTTFWELFKVIAAFTLAHTITLTLAVLNVVHLPAVIVEPMIAASIVVVALQNALFPTRTRGTGRLLVAFFFGLFHGLGFAGGLLSAMQGMQTTAVAIAIVAFSVGVELGHQVVVLPVFALRQLSGRWAGRSPATTDRVLRVGSVAIGLAGIFYLVVAVSAGFRR